MRIKCKIFGLLHFTTKINRNVNETLCFYVLYYLKYIFTCIDNVDVKSLGSEASFIGAVDHLINIYSINVTVVLKLSITDQ